jgi:flagellar biogenesis protein FliO
LATGSRQRVVLVRVRDKDLLLGVSMQQINTLAEWPAPIDEQRPMLRGTSTPLPVTQGLPKAVVPAAEALAKFLRKK